jgi:hypothetical protein
MRGLPFHARQREALVWRNVRAAECRFERLPVTRWYFAAHSAAKAPHAGTGTSAQLPVTPPEPRSRRLGFRYQA